MVLAEVPLWVIHQTSSSSAAAVGATGRPPPPVAAVAATTTTTTKTAAVGEEAIVTQNGASTSAPATAHAAARPGGGGAERAKSTLALLTGLNHSRCAIYSVDVHPSGTKFATAGGDGKVRLWNIHMLGFFLQQRTIQHNNNTNNNERGGDDDEDDLKEKQGDMLAGGPNDKTQQIKKKKRMARFEKGGRYESSEEASSTSSSSYASHGSASGDRGGGEGGGSCSDSDGGGSAIDMEGGGGEKAQRNEEMQRKSGNGTSVSSSEEEEIVHDITNLVRRKKGGGTGGSGINGGGKLPNSADLNPSNNDSGDGQSQPNQINDTSKENETEQVAKSNKKRKRVEESLTSAVTSFPSSSLSKDGMVANAPNFRESKTTTPSNYAHKRHSHQQRLLCTLSTHSGSVLSVRFSTTGTYLASAGDDGAVCIHTQSHHKSHITTGNLININTNKNDGQEEEEVEHWRRIKICRGHNLDVVGLAWAPDDTHLVSCSLDSETPIIVWKLTDLYHHHHPQQHHHHHQHHPTDGQYGGHHHQHQHSMKIICPPYKILGKNVHTSTVKGVTFDPAGSYLASSGDDPAICIWRAYDDWGLERRIDSSVGIFRRPSSSRKKQGEDEEEEEERRDDVSPAELADLSLFRRISWSTDGTYVCGTNATVRGKNVAAMVSREGWVVTGEKNAVGASGAANLVGHKQPVVCSRHCPYLFDATPSSSSSLDEDDDEVKEPEYATLLALGDKRGFVTIWSTRKSRPVFKLQCSESRCTVTDLSWGRVKGGGMILLVSLLDGFVVSLHFAVPGELGRVLSEEGRKKVFRLKYGIDLDEEGDDTIWGGLRTRRKLVDDDSGPKLIENALQFTLEARGAGRSISGLSDNEDGGEKQQKRSRLAPMANVKSQQVESRSSKTGKKRIQPVLMSIDDGSGGDENDTTRDGEEKKREDARESMSLSASDLMDERMKGDGSRSRSEAVTPKDGKKGRIRMSKKDMDSTDHVKDALTVASKAASVAEGLNAKSAKRGGGQQRPRRDAEMAENRAKLSEPTDGQDRMSSPTETSLRTPAALRMTHRPLAIDTIPHSTNRINSVDLPSLPTVPGIAAVADCTNSVQTPPGSSGPPVPCTTLSISCKGKVNWRDQIVGTSCSALSAVSSLLAVGTSDGCIYLYGTSPTCGWASGMAFRSHPPLVLGAAVVTVHLRYEKGKINNDSMDCDAKVSMLVLTSDGAFGMYFLTPKPLLQYKGTVLPAITHMRLSGMHGSRQQSLDPKVARMQITESNHLLLILSLQTPASHQGVMGQHSAGGASKPSGSSLTKVGVGGSLQAFVYSRPMELWMRISDSRFILSDFYTTLSSLETTRQDRSSNVLSQIDDSVRTGASASLLTASRRSRAIPSSDGTTSVMYHHGEDEGGTTSGNTVTRSHCEDRMACALALGSAGEFKHWFSLYVRRLTMEGNAIHLRFVFDMLVGVTKKSVDSSTSYTDTSELLDEKDQLDSFSCWWLSGASTLLKLNKLDLIRNVMIPEMSKNRALQRVTNEIAMEIGSLVP